ncbi:hypothetical protein [Kibdelosporangium phytohabitans]|uniref:Uncharacterized protein n=1 Tax=Kibdelosporangium phytohabitans TaxID=860235 RepID=A0A0N7F2W6_9PSEU|nr:hypothetical protein [Kibdelosporangium phytohabitans]ALG06975.1 hypothetical protein AOZ06_08595 [Kibdelosporangium phytohabitans]MBE1468257.1 hypothetical protein [Kibdelosporangium phytohabitans]
MSTVGEQTPITLADLPILSSFPSWRGFALHSLVIVAVYRCVVCDRPRESTMVATRGECGELICPKCFAHLVRTENRGLPHQLD